jgi:hypothetical protein
VGGEFTTIGGQPRNGIARLDPVTGLADSFDPQADSHVYAITMQPDGKILVGGDFGMIGGQPRSGIARLDPTSGLADLFDPEANSTVEAITLQADGKVLVGGFFTLIGGNKHRNKIARLDGTTGAPDSFNPNPGWSPDYPAESRWVYSIAVQPDGKVLAGGTFTTMGGVTNANYFARLRNDTVASQNLAVTQSTVTWNLSGSSPQFTRVTVEYSTDNINYSLLGVAIASGSNWALTGLNLPTAQNLYIRARGYCSSGGNGSGSIVESVRNAFIPVLHIQSITRLANGHTVLQCLGAANEVNDLQVSPDLNSGNFRPVSPLPVAADASGAFSYDDAGAAGQTKRFYRLAFP